MRRRKLIFQLIVHIAACLAMFYVGAFSVGSDVNWVCWLLAAIFFIRAILLFNILI